jgi:hypothetical protein
MWLSNLSLNLTLKLGGSVRSAGWRSYHIMLSDVTAQMLQDRDPARFRAPPPEKGEAKSSAALTG